MRVEVLTVALLVVVVTVGWADARVITTTPTSVAVQSEDRFAKYFELLGEIWQKVLIPFIPRALTLVLIYGAESTVPQPILKPAEAAVGGAEAIADTVYHKVPLVAPVVDISTGIVGGIASGVLDFASNTLFSLFQ